MKVAPYTLNLNGRLLTMTRPQVMGILNLTPDSFYAASRAQTEADVVRRVRQVRDEGAQWVDVGAYSSRPGADDVTVGEEMQRLRVGLRLLRAQLGEDFPVSVDTFRADVARMCVEEYGVQMINDISGGQLDRNMFRMVASLHVPYVLTHIQGTPSTMQDAPTYDNLVRDVFVYFSRRLETLRELGVCDVVVDPGFGFGKTLDQNYELMRHLQDFQELNCPILVGVSRKSMIRRLLDVTPADALTGTIALHAVALLSGAHFLRVHDVREAVQTVRVVSQLI